MKTIRELVDIVNVQKIRQIELITNDSNVPFKIKKLYDGLSSNKIKSDDEAINYLYGENGSAKAYSRIKNRLKDRLINTLFFIDVNQYSKSKYEIALHKIKRNSAVVAILLDRSKRFAAMDLAEKTIKLAIKYDVIDSVLILGKHLKVHYSLFSYNKNKKKYYSKLLKEYFEYYKQELMVEDVFLELARSVLHNLDLQKTANQLEDEIKELEKIKEDNDNYFFNYYYYNSMYFIKMSERNYEDLLEITESAIQFFSRKTDFTPIALFGQRFKKGYTILNLGRIEEALEAFEVCKEMGPTPGNISWFNIHAYICMTAIILGRYEYALETFSTVARNNNYKELDKSFKEPWLIKEAYLNFLIKMKKVDPSDYELPGFKIGRFLNEVPLYSKDKRGYNIAIIIIQLLFFLLDKKFSKFIDRMDALNQYSYRYLRNDDTLRSNCFIKMMLKIPDTNYHPEAVKRHTKKFLKTLTNTKPDIREHSSNIEIIPYENLWEMVLELLEKQKG